MKLNGTYQYETVWIGKIKISKAFQLTHCTEAKIEKAENEFRINDCFQKPIVLDENYTLIDGYSRYLAAQRLQLNTIPCLIAVAEKKEPPKPESSEIIIGTFYDGKKEYAWSNPDNIPVSVGDFVVAETKNGATPLVRVTRIVKNSKKHPCRSIRGNVSQDSVFKAVLGSFLEYMGIGVSTDDFKLFRCMTENCKPYYKDRFHKELTEMTPDQCIAWDACETISSYLEERICR